MIGRNCKYEDSFQRGEAHHRIPEYVVNKGMPSATAVYESNVWARGIRAHSPSRVHLTDETGAKPFENKEHVHVAFQYETDRKSVV